MRWPVGPGEGDEMVETEVDVEVTARCTVRIKVQHEPGEDPCDLTREDERKVHEALPDYIGGDWSVEMEAEVVEMSDSSTEIPS